MNWYLKGEFKKQNIFPGGKIKVYLNEWISILDLIDLLNMNFHHNEANIRSYLDNVNKDAIKEIKGIECIHINKVINFINAFKPGENCNEAYIERYINLNKYIEYTIIDNRKIIVIFKGKVNIDEEWQLLGKEFTNSEQVALWIGTDKYYINKVLNGELVNGREWKPNIFYKNVDDNKQIRYIVVYRDEWDSYSERKRRNRIDKLLTD